MDYLRGNNKGDASNEEDIEIQIVGWHNYDDHELDEELTGEDNEFNVLITGIDSLKRSVAVYVEGFKPFFFIQIPNDWKKSHVSILAEACKKHYMIDEMYCEDLEKFSIVKRKPFYGYTHDDMFKFAKLVFRNKGAFHAYQNIFRRPLRVRDLFGGQEHYYELFESSVEPMLRMMHVRDIQASGWIRVCAKDYHVNKPSLSNCQYDITVPYKKIVGIKKDAVGDILFAGFDIEADSSHGDFPIAHKDYKKLARDIFNEYINLVNGKSDTIKECILEYILLAFEDCFNQNEIDYIGLSVVPKNLKECAEAILIADFVGLENILKKYFKLEKEVCKRLATQIVSEHKRLLYINDKVYLHRQRETLAFILKLAFNPFYNAASVNVVYTKNNDKPSREAIEAVSKEVFRLCSLYTENMKKKKRLNAGKKNLISRKEKDALREELAGDDYDLSHYIELINNVMNEQFPAVQGDNLIQIGTTFQKLGEPDCFLKHIIVLDSCDDISNDELVRDENKDTEFPLEDLENYIKQHGLEEFSLDNVEDIGGYLKSCTPEEKRRLNDHLIKLNYMRQAETDKADVVVEVYDNMKDVLLAWTRLIVLSDVDVIIGYNIFGFDFKFMYECAQVCDCVEEFMQIGKMKGLVQKMHVQGHNIKDTNKKQSMDDMAHNIEMHGRLVIDLFKVIQTSYNLDSYKLDNVCEKFLYKNKNDLPPKEIFRLQKGDSGDRCTIAKYCIIDCVLCNRLLIKLQILMNNIGMSNVCSVPLMYLFLRGQGIKGLSFVSKICRAKGYLINTLKKQEETSEKYEGAIVLRPTTKIYIDDPVCVADFNSLYPSCMISENLSHDSLAGVYNCYKCIDIDKLEAAGKHCGCYKFDSKYAHIKEVEYVDIQYDIYDYIDDYNAQGMVKKEKKKIKSGIKTCRFAQLPDGKKSIIPEILQEFLKQRKNTRKIQKNFPEKSFEWNIYEGLQLAYKITANSIYGLTGAQTSKIYLPEIAASTTATGRNLIKITKKHYESHYDCKVVYGDSVTGDTPVIIRNRGVVTVATMESLVEREKDWSEYDEKQQVTFIGLEVWTERGWTKVNRLIRHKTNKKIYRVLTHTGCVDVTEDHSLLDHSGRKIAPKDCVVGTSLLYSELPILKETNVSVTAIEAWAMGFFMADGSCGKYVTKWGIKYSWAINNACLDYLNQAKDYLKKSTNQEFKILDTLKSSGVYKLVPVGGMKNITLKYRALVYREKEKIVPQCILEAPLEIAREFWNGYYIGDGDKDIYTRCDAKNKLTCQSLYMLMTKIGFKVSLNNRTDKQNIYRLTATKRKQRKPCDSIKKIEEVTHLYHSCYVYDFETENHHFQAGIGKMIVHNTDSVFIRFNCKDLNGKKLHGLDAINKSIMHCTEGALAISRQLKKPHNLEFEKSIFPFILISKKRYHGHYYTEYGSSKYSPKSMGIVLKRRDNANICKEIFGNAIREIMLKQDLEASLQMIKNCLRKLLDGEYPYEMFIISKTLRSYYKAPDTVAHNVLARRIARRDPGNKPQTNDRVPYIYVQVSGDDGKKRILQGDRVENPDYARVMKLKIDYKFYLERQVMQPILQVFKLDSRYYEKCKKLFDNTLMEYETKRNKNQKITAFFKVVPKTEKSFNPSKKSEKEEEEEEEEEENNEEEEDNEEEEKVDLVSYEF